MFVLNVRKSWELWAATTADSLVPVSLWDLAPPVEREVLFCWKWEKGRILLHAPRLAQETSAAPQGDFLIFGCAPFPAFLQLTEREKAFEDRMHPGIFSAGGMFSLVPG